MIVLLFSSDVVFEEDVLVITKGIKHNEQLNDNHSIQVCSLSAEKTTVMHLNTISSQNVLLSQICHC
jgi:hypothetical protein